ncbi:MAG: 5-formyltetrahydrofolate cyclo-ligase [Burkholderiaceae bacterium]
MSEDEARLALRRRLVTERAALADRAAREHALRQRVAHWLEHADARAVGFYWPIRGEPDVRAPIGAWLSADTSRVAALPVIVGSLLQFQAWSPEAPMRAGEFGIPVPARGRVVQPDCLLIPCLGFDEHKFRLGYGGGFYDRTLAALVPWPLAVGVAFECGKVPTIDPHAGDMALDTIITDEATY